MGPAAAKGEEPREGWPAAPTAAGGMGAGRGPASSGSATVTGPSRGLARPAVLSLSLSLRRPPRASRAGLPAAGAER